MRKLYNKAFLFSVCICCETIPLSASYWKLQGFVHPIYHFYYSKGHCHKSADLQPSAWSSTHQGIKSRHDIRTKNPTATYGQQDVLSWAATLSDPADISLWATVSGQPSRSLWASARDVHGICGLSWCVSRSSAAFTDRQNCQRAAHQSQRRRHSAGCLNSYKRSLHVIL